MGLNVFESLGMKLFSAAIEASFATTDLLDGTTRAQYKRKKEAKTKKESSSDEEEDIYGEELTDETEAEELSAEDAIGMASKFVAKSSGKKEIIVNEDKIREVNDYPAVVAKESDEDSDRNLFSVKEDESTSGTITNSKLDEIIKNYNYRDKLFASTILYICGKISADQLGALISSIDSTKKGVKSNIEYINSITKYFTGVNFAPNPEYKDKEFVFEDSQMAIVREIAGLDLLAGNPAISQIIEKLRKWAADNGKSIIIFDNTKLDIYKDDAPASVVRLVKEAMGDFINDYKHKISKLRSGMVEIAIIRDYGTIDTYLVDPGIIVGQGVKLLVNAPNGQEIFTSHPPIVRRAIANKSFVMTAEEMKNVLINENQFFNQNLYTIFDLSASKRIFTNITREDASLLERRLQMVVDIVNKEFGGICRMRIKNYKDPNSFIIVSDYKCKVPMEEMISVVFDGLVIKVNGGEIIVKVNDPNGNVIFTDTVNLEEFEKELVNGGFPINTVLNQRAALVTA